MDYISLDQVLPELAEEIYVITASRGNGGLPSGDYGLVEMYCRDPDCDCRRVFLSVVSSRLKKSIAVIVFGWESKNFYAEWFGADESYLRRDPDLLDRLKGPCLNSCSPQSKYAAEALRAVSETALKDRAYIEVLKRHYKLFKRKVKETPYNVDD